MDTLIENCARLEKASAGTQNECNALRETAARAAADRNVSGAPSLLRAMATDFTSGDAMLPAGCTPLQIVAAECLTVLYLAIKPIPIDLILSYLQDSLYSRRWSSHRDGQGLVLWSRATLQCAADHKPLEQGGAANVFAQQPPRYAPDHVYQECLPSTVVIGTSTTVSVHDCFLPEGWSPGTATGAAGAQGQPHGQPQEVAVSGTMPSPPPLPHSTLPPSVLQARDALRARTVELLSKRLRELHETFLLVSDASAEGETGTRASTGKTGTERFLQTRTAESSGAHAVAYTRTAFCLLRDCLRWPETRALVWRAVTPFLSLDALPGLHSLPGYMGGQAGAEAGGQGSVMPLHAEARALLADAALVESRVVRALRSRTPPVSGHPGAAASEGSEHEADTYALHVCAPALLDLLQLKPRPASSPAVTTAIAALASTHPRLRAHAILHALTLMLAAGDLPDPLPGKSVLSGPGALKSVPAAVVAKGSGSAKGGGPAGQARSWQYIYACLMLKALLAASAPAAGREQQHPEGYPSASDVLARLLAPSLSYAARTVPNPVLTLNEEMLPLPPPPPKIVEKPLAIRGYRDKAVGGEGAGGGGGGTSSAGQKRKRKPAKETGETGDTRAGEGGAEQQQPFQAGEDAPSGDVNMSAEEGSSGTANSKGRRVHWAPEAVAEEGVAAGDSRYSRPFLQVMYIEPRGEEPFTMPQPPPGMEEEGGTAMEGVEAAVVEAAAAATEHSQSAHEGKVWQCPVDDCRKQFSDPSRLRTHTQGKDEAKEEEQEKAQQRQGEAELDVPAVHPPDHSSAAASSSTSTEPAAECVDPPSDPWFDESLVPFEPYYGAQPRLKEVHPLKYGSIGGVGVGVLPGMPGGAPLHAIFAAPPGIQPSALGKALALHAQGGSPGPGHALAHTLPAWDAYKQVYPTTLLAHVLTALNLDVTVAAIAKGGVGTEAGTHSSTTHGGLGGTGSSGHSGGQSGTVVATTSSAGASRQAIILDDSVGLTIGGGRSSGGGAGAMQHSGGWTGGGGGSGGTGAGAGQGGAQITSSASHSIPVDLLRDPWLQSKVRAQRVYTYAVSRGLGLTSSGEGAGDSSVGEQLATGGRDGVAATDDESSVTGSAPGGVSASSIGRTSGRQSTTPSKRGTGSAAQHSAHLPSTLAGLAALSPLPSWILGPAGRDGLLLPESRGMALARAVVKEKEKGGKKEGSAGPEGGHTGPSPSVAPAPAHTPVSVPVLDLPLCTGAVSLDLLTTLCTTLSLCNTVQAIVDFDPLEHHTSVVSSAADGSLQSDSGTGVPSSSASAGTGTGSEQEGGTGPTDANAAGKLDTRKPVAGMLTIVDSAFTSRVHALHAAAAVLGYVSTLLEAVVEHDASTTKLLQVLRRQEGEMQAKAESAAKTAARAAAIAADAAVEKAQKERARLAAATALAAGAAPSVPMAPQAAGGRNAPSPVPSAGSGLMSPPAQGLPGGAAAVGMSSHASGSTSGQVQAPGSVGSAAGGLAGGSSLPTSLGGKLGGGLGKPLGSSLQSTGGMGTGAGVGGTLAGGLLGRPGGLGSSLGLGGGLGAGLKRPLGVALGTSMGLGAGVGKGPMAIASGVAVPPAPVQTQGQAEVSVEGGPGPKRPRLGSDTGLDGESPVAKEGSTAAATTNAAAPAPAPAPSARMQPKENDSSDESSSEEDDDDGLSSIAISMPTLSGTSRRGGVAGPGPGHTNGYGSSANGVNGRTSAGAGGQADDTDGLFLNGAGFMPDLSEKAAAIARARAGSSGSGSLLSASSAATTNGQAGAGAGSGSGAPGSASGAGGSDAPESAILLQASRHVLMFGPLVGDASQYRSTTAAPLLHTQAAAFVQRTVSALLAPLRTRDRALLLAAARVQGRDPSYWEWSVYLERDEEDAAQEEDLMAGVQGVKVLRLGGWSARQLESMEEVEARELTGAYMGRLAELVGRAREEVDPAKQEAERADREAAKAARREARAAASAQRKAEKEATKASEKAARAAAREAAREEKRRAREEAKAAKAAAAAERAAAEGGADGYVEGDDAGAEGDDSKEGMDEGGEGEDLSSEWLQAMAHEEQNLSRLQGTGAQAEAEAESGADAANRRTSGRKPVPKALDGEGAEGEEASAEGTAGAVSTRGGKGGRGRGTRLATTGARGAGSRGRGGSRGGRGGKSKGGPSALETDPLSVPLAVAAMAHLTSLGAEGTMIMPSAPSLLEQAASMGLTMAGVGAGQGSGGMLVLPPVPQLLPLLPPPTGIGAAVPVAGEGEDMSDEEGPEEGEESAEEEDSEEESEGEGGTRGIGLGLDALSAPMGLAALHQQLQHPGPRYPSAIDPDLTAGTVWVPDGEGEGSGSEEEEDAEDAQIDAEMAALERMQGGASAGGGAGGEEGGGEGTGGGGGGQGGEEDTAPSGSSSRQVRRKRRAPAPYEEEGGEPVRSVGGKNGRKGGGSTAPAPPARTPEAAAAWRARREELRAGRELRRAKARIYIQWLKDAALTKRWYKAARTPYVRFIRLRALPVPPPALPSPPQGQELACNNEPPVTPYMLLPRPVLAGSLGKAWKRYRPGASSSSSGAGASAGAGAGGDLMEEGGQGEEGAAGPDTSLVEGEAGGDPSSSVAGQPSTASSASACGASVKLSTVVEMNKEHAVWWRLPFPHPHRPVPAQGIPLPQETVKQLMQPAIDALQASLAAVKIGAASQA